MYNAFSIICHFNCKIKLKLLICNKLKLDKNISFKFMQTVTQDTLVRIVEGNAPILITVMNVKVNVIVIKTSVMYLLDVQMPQKVLHCMYNMS